MIFLDVDGVLADFTSPLLRFFDSNVPDDDLEWELWKSIGVTESEFVEAVAAPGFFRRLPVYEGAWEFFDRLREMAPVTFCTAVFPSETSFSDRFNWLVDNEFLAPGQRGGFVITAEKHLLASPDRILIDDCEENVNRFREAGGRAILFPRPWNSWRAKSDEWSEGCRQDHVIEQTLEALDELISAGFR